MSKHTPGPWGIEEGINCLYVGPVVERYGRERVVTPVADCNFVDELGEKETLANAARIVACVNACEGIEDPANLRTQMDAMAETLRSSISILMTWRDDFASGDEHKRTVINTLIHQMSDAASLAEMGESIARAEGKAK